MMHHTLVRKRFIALLVLAASATAAPPAMALDDDGHAAGQYRPVHPRSYPLNLPEGTPVRSGVPLTTHLRILDDEDPVYRLYALNQIARFSSLGGHERRVHERVKELVGADGSDAVRLAALRLMGRLSPEDAIAQSERLVQDEDAPSELRVGAWVVGMEHDAERFGPMLEAVAGDGWSSHRQRALWWSSLHVEPESVIAAAIAAMELASPGTNIDGAMQAPRRTNDPNPGRFSEIRQWEVLFQVLGRGMDRLEHPMPTELSERLGGALAERIKAHLTNTHFQRAYRTRHPQRTPADLREAMQQFLAEEHGKMDTQWQPSTELEFEVNRVMQIATGGSMAEVLWVLDRDPVAQAAAVAAIEAWDFAIPEPAHVIRAADEREEQHWRDLRDLLQETAEMLWIGFRASLNRDRSDWRTPSSATERLGLDDIFTPQSLLSADDRRFYDALVAPPER